MPSTTRNNQNFSRNGQNTGGFRRNNTQQTQRQSQGQQTQQQRARQPQQRYTPNSSQANNSRQFQAGHGTARPTNSSNRARTGNQPSTGGNARTGTLVVEHPDGSRVNFPEGSKIVLAVEGQTGNDAQHLNC